MCVSYDNDTIYNTKNKKIKKSINNRIHVLTTMLLNSTIFFIQAFILVPKKILNTWNIITGIHFLCTIMNIITGIHFVNLSILESNNDYSPS